MTKDLRTKLGRKKKLSSSTLRTLARAEDLKISGRHEKAIEILQSLLTREPECLEAVEEISDNFLSLDEFEKARNSAEFALSLDSKSSIANHILGFLILQNDDFKTAVKFLQKANESDANNPEILRCLGWALFHTGKRSEGIAVLQRSISLDSQNVMGFCDLGVCFLQQENFAVAKRLFQKALEIDPDCDRAAECLDLVEKVERGDL